MAADGTVNRDDMDSLTERIIGCGFAVSNALGCGFLEKVYENALAHELGKAGLRVRRRWPIKVSYDGVVVGEYAADLLVEDCVLLELKAVRELDDVHMARCLNYLKATGLRLCPLMNFGEPKLRIKRIVNNH